MILAMWTRLVKGWSCWCFFFRRFWTQIFFGWRKKTNGFSKDSRPLFDRVFPANHMGGWRTSIYSDSASDAFRRQAITSPRRTWKIHLDVSKNSGFSPQIIHFNRAFHYKPSILGCSPYFWKHPFIQKWLFQLDDEPKYQIFTRKNGWKSPNNQPFLKVDVGLASRLKKKLALKMFEPFGENSLVNTEMDFHPVE